MKYAIYNIENGYMRHDEDMSNEIGYEFEIDEYTIFFDTLQTASNNADHDDLIMLHEDNKLPVGIVTHIKMTAEEFKRKYGVDV